MAAVAIVASQIKGCKVYKLVVSWGVCSQKMWAELPNRSMSGLPKRGLSGLLRRAPSAAMAQTAEALQASLDEGLLKQLAPLAAVHPYRLEAQVLRCTSCSACTSLMHACMQRCTSWIKACSHAAMHLLHAKFTGPQNTFYIDSIVRSL